MENRYIYILWHNQILYYKESLQPDTSDICHHSGQCIAMENVLRDYFRVILYQWLYIISVEVNRHYVID